MPDLYEMEKKLKQNINQFIILNKTNAILDGCYNIESLKKIIEVLEEIKNNND